MKYAHDRGGRLYFESILNPTRRAKKILRKEKLQAKLDRLSKQKYAFLAPGAAKWGLDGGPPKPGKKVPFYDRPENRKFLGSESRAHPFSSKSEWAHKDKKKKPAEWKDKNHAHR